LWSGERESGTISDGETNRREGKKGVVEKEVFSTKKKKKGRGEEKHESLTIGMKLPKQKKVP